MIRKILHMIMMAVLDRLSLLIVGLWVIVIGMIAPKYTTQTLLNLADHTRAAMRKSDKEVK